MAKRVTTLAASIVVNDPQMGACAAIVVAVNKDGTINAIGWTSMGANRTWTSVRHKDAPPGQDETQWDLLTWEQAPGAP